MMHKDSLGNEPPSDWGDTPGGPAEMHGFPTEGWMFTPAADIKVKDLAEIIAISQMTLPQDFFDARVPEHLKKHFKFKKFEM
jgi:hypothetical protein